MPNVISNDFLNLKFVSTAPEVSRKRRVEVDGSLNTATSNDGSAVLAFLPFEPKISALPLACPALALKVMHCALENPKPAVMLISVRYSLYCDDGRPGVPL